MNKLTKEEIDSRHKEIPLWVVADDLKMLSREFAFADFAEAIEFANKIATLAEEENHHPDLQVSWGKVVVQLSTHDVDGLSEKDFILATKIDTL